MIKSRQHKLPFQRKTMWHIYNCGECAQVHHEKVIPLRGIEPRPRP